MTDYQKQAQDFLTKHSIKFKAIFKGDKCPMWEDGKHMHGDRYLVTFHRTINYVYSSFSLSFWNSVNDKQAGKEPTPYDALACLTKYDPGTFDNFCGDFGYDTDSRKAEKTYKAVIVEWQKVEKFFTREEIEELAEIN
jgi:hypothetical protein